MKLLLTIAFTLTLGTAAQAACFADYKAKTDNPLRLHYGVVQVSDAACRSTARAEAEVRDRLRGHGWTLLNVLSTFDESGLDQRKENAGRHFLRY